MKFPWNAVLCGETGFNCYHSCCFVQEKRSSSTLVSKTNIKISQRLLRKKMLPDPVWGRKLLCEMTFGSLLGRAWRSWPSAWAHFWVVLMGWRPPLRSQTHSIRIIGFSWNRRTLNFVEAFMFKFIKTQASLVVQMVKNLPIMQETWVWSLGWDFPWKRKWLPTLVFLPGEFHDQKTLVGYSPWGHKELDTTDKEKWAIKTWEDIEET